MASRISASGRVIWLGVASVLAALSIAALLSHHCWILGGSRVRVCMCRKERYMPSSSPRYVVKEEMFKIFAWACIWELSGVSMTHAQVATLRPECKEASQPIRSGWVLECISFRIVMPGGDEALLGGGVIEYRRRVQIVSPITWNVIG